MIYVFSERISKKVQAWANATPDSVLPGIIDRNLYYHSRLIKAPAGGIPARVGMIPGMARCEIWKRDKDTDRIKRVLREGEPVERDVYNWLVSVVCDTGDRFGIADFDRAGTWWIEAADCSDT